MDKQKHRQTLLEQRRSLSLENWRDRSQALCQRLQALARFQSAQSILAYFSFRQEPDLSALWRSHPEKNWIFPRCVGKTLQWHRWQLGQPLVSGAYGIQEPSEQAEVFEPQQADLILVPAVGCDRRCNRLGYGGGFYDRTLSLEGMATIPTFGIVFDFALLEALPQDPWDQPLSGVCTERQLIQRLNPASESGD